MNKKGFTPHLWTYSKNNKKNEYNKGAGFTLLEILIAAVIMAMVTTGLAYVFLAGKRHLLHTRSRIQVAELGRLFLAPLQMQVNQSQWGNNCLSNTTLCTPETQSLDGIPYTATYTTSLVGTTTLRKVKVDITWTEPSP